MEFGKELIIDIHDCKNLPCDRVFLRKYLELLCDLIDMKREDLHFWDYEGYPEEYEEALDHLKGVSVVQFIKTSSIVIHTLDVSKRVYINVFSCKDFNPGEVKQFSEISFRGKIVKSHIIERE